MGRSTGGAWVAAGLTSQLCSISSLPHLTLAGVRRLNADDMGAWAVEPRAAAAADSRGATIDADELDYWGF